MVLLSLEGIDTGETILAEHVKQIIRLLTGVDIVDVKLKGDLRIEEGKLYISNTQVAATADDINKLKDIVAGVVSAQKPIIPNASKEIDYLLIKDLVVEKFTNKNGGATESAASAYMYENCL